MPAKVIVASQVLVADDLVAQRVRKVRVDPCANLVAERALAGGVVEIQEEKLGGGS
jgi:hypothetical protein